MSENKIKWGCIQPLTGGMYLGAEHAIGHKAEWIISYPGLTDYIYDSKDKNHEGEPVDAGNERNIFNYLQKNNRLPEWYCMNRTMMQNDEDYNPTYTAHPEANMVEGAQPNLDVDIVVAVPVCAGLSMASTAHQERKDECNCQMIWMAKYALKTIKPKVYIFENAPTLMSGRGDEVRDQLETIAMESGYSVVYYKTDTRFHHNCQKRPRTFIMFFKHKDGKPFIPVLNYERETVSIEQFFNELVKRENDPMNAVTENEIWVDTIIEYAHYHFGNDWRNKIQGRDLFFFIAYNKEEREPFINWLKENKSEKTVAHYTRYINHIDEKMAINKGWWATTAKYFSDFLPACMYKNMPLIVHYNEDRLYTMREWLWTMGHPADFDMVGIPWAYFRKIGQNVPVNTAKWITSEAIRIINNWDNEETVSETQNVGFYDNAKQRRIWPAKENNQMEIPME